MEEVGRVDDAGFGVLVVGEAAADKWEKSEVLVWVCVV